MPSSPNYKRDYDQEYKTSKKRGEQGTGKENDGAKRKRARRKMIKLHGALSSDQVVEHKKPLKEGGSNKMSNLKIGSLSSNAAEGGEIGSKKGKAAGARKGHKARVKVKK